MSSSCADSRRVLPLLTETDPVSGTIRRSILLEIASDGLTIRLIHIDSCRQGAQQEYCVEIATNELIDLVRTHGADNQLIDSQGFKFNGIG